MSTIGSYETSALIDRMRYDILQGLKSVSPCDQCGKPACAWGRWCAACIRNELASRVGEMRVDRLVDLLAEMRGLHVRIERAIREILEAEQ